MERKTISTSMLPEVLIETVEGNLLVRGWERSEVAVSAEPETLKLEEKEDRVRLSCQGDCEIHLPYSASLQVESVHGDAHLKLLQDQLTIESVHGSLTLRNVAATNIQAIHGDFSARGVSGDLNIEQIHGNASVIEVQGDCTLPEVQGNLSLRQVQGEVKTSVEGNAHVRLSQMSGMEYRIRAEGNVNCLVPEETGLKLDLTSDGEMIKIGFPEHSRTYRQAHLELTLGEGEVSLIIQASGVIFLSSQPSLRVEGEAIGFGFEADFGAMPGDFNEQIARQVEAQIAEQMEMMSREMSEQMSRLSEKIGRSGLSQEEVERVMEQARQASERATSRAQEKMRRAQEKLERKLEAAQRRNAAKMEQAERRAYARRSWDFPPPPHPHAPPAPPKEPVSDEERLMILRMLEQKKISLEEAEQLLAALEGNS